MKVEINNLVSESFTKKNGREVKKLVGSYFATMEIDAKELKEIYDEFEEAKDKMSDCLRRLEDIGFLKIKNATDLLPNPKSAADDKTVH